MGTLHEDVSTFMTVSGWILLTVRNISNKPCREKSKHAFYIQQRFSKNLAVCVIMSKNVVVPEKPQIWRMRVACRISKTTRAQIPPHPYTHTNTEMCNSYCFSTAIVVSCTRLNVTLHVRCLSCIKQEVLHGINQCNMSSCYVLLRLCITSRSYLEWKT
jgi:hypothetical protein